MSPKYLGTLSLMFVVAVGGWACSTNDQTSEPSTISSQAYAHCPMALSGVQVTRSETDSGVLLTFTTDLANVSDLRQRVRAMAQMYQQHQGHGPMMWQHMGPRHGPGMLPPNGMGPGRGMGPGPMPALNATVEDIEGGARLFLTPVNPADLELLQEHLQMHQQRMQSGECWMSQA